MKAPARYAESKPIKIQTIELAAPGPSAYLDLSAAAARGAIGPKATPGAGSAGRSASQPAQRLFHRSNAQQFGAINDAHDAVPDITDAVFAQRAKHAAGMDWRYAGAVGDLLPA